ncbi:MAG: hypothetical protein JWN81_947 [Solirubrobacterales bacterium]|nr:hypothetical protein [Solirubrobacterales bacterium]
MVDASTAMRTAARIGMSPRCDARSRCTHATVPATVSSQPSPTTITASGMGTRTAS